ncbi:hypothetical protein ACJX0J_040541 [Zea mays]
MYFGDFCRGNERMGEEEYFFVISLSILIIMFGSVNKLEYIVCFGLILIIMQWIKTCLKYILTHNSRAHASNNF